jgi:CDP-diacylglycerol--serine O-phosphatidyltransferase
MASPSTKPRRRIVSTVNFAWLLPNLLTLSALASGMTAIRFALVDRFEAAVFMVALAGVLDMLDGRMARMLKSSSNFGAHMDSLSDMAVFGVVPAILLYLFALEEGGRIAWATCLFFAACCALRLARFNSELHDAPTWAANYFTGIPSPAAALLALLPVIASFCTDFAFVREVPFLGLWLVIVGIGAISTIPTFAGKGMKIPRSLALPALGMCALVIAGFLARPWEMMLGVGLFYIALIPVSVISFIRVRAKAAKP